MKIYWKSDAENEKSKDLFKPLDTEKFEFQTNETGNIQVNQMFLSMKSKKLLRK